MSRETVSFDGPDGQRLAALIDRPDAPPRAWALFAHCFTCSKDGIAASHIARTLAGHGIAVLRFDFTGLGASEGEFADTHFSSNLADLRAAVDWLRATHAAPTLLVGHSLGGAAVLAIAGDVPEVRAVATLGAPSDPAHVVRQFGDRVDAIRAHGEAEVELGGRPFTIRDEFLDDVAAQDPDARIAALDAALLVMHSPDDRVVGIDEAAAIYQRARHPKSFVALDGADHLLSRREDAAWAADLIAAWSARYLD
jgi:alpha/beta superfamily hydrolase